MKFKQFLVELSKPYINQSDIIYQSILDNLDHGHVSHDEHEIKFNVGKIIKNSAYDNLNVIVRQYKSNEVKLGKHKESGTPTIVILTKSKLPSDRTKIDSFLEHPDLATKIKKTIRDYLETHHDSTQEKEPTSASSYEKPKLYAAKFEEHYATVINDVKRIIKDYKDTKRYLLSKVQATGNEGKKSVTQAAINSSFKQHFGDSFKEFLGKLKGIEGAKFMDHIPKDLKEKALSRLESFYDQEIASLKDSK